MRIGRGKAFGLEKEEESVPVKAVRQTLDGRDFIIEISTLHDLAPLMEALPEAGEAAGEVRSAGLRQVPERLRTIRQAGAPRFERGRMVGVEKVPAWAHTRNDTRHGIPVPRKGVILDYQLLGSTSSITLGAGMTFLVMDTVYASSLIAEGGAVVKYTNSTSSKISVSGSVSCNVSQFRPTVMTGLYDNTIGEVIATSATPPMYYANVALEVTSYAGTLENLRIRQAQTAIKFNYSGAGIALRHVQIVDCQTGLATASTGGATFYAGNLLMTNVLTGFGGSNYTGNAEHLTADNVGALISGSGVQGMMNLKNGVFANVASVTTNAGSVWGTYNGFFNTASFGTPAFTTTNSPFESVGAGGYYLATNTTFRNVGTSSIDSTLASALQKKTTYPPIVLTGYLWTNIVLSPQAQRDFDGAYDLGWHFDPLDYCMGEFILPTDSMVLTNGVAVGVFGAYGTRLSAGNFFSEGTPLNPNWMVPYHAVQEQPVIWGTTSASRWLVRVDALTDPMRDVRVRFTRFCFPGDSYAKCMVFANNGGTATTFEVRDCFLSGIYWDFNCRCDLATTANLVNNVFERGLVALSQDYGAYLRPFLALNLYNNLFWQTGISYYYDNPTTPWTAKDNVFDNIILYRPATNVVNGNNGYINCTPMSGGSNNVVVTNFTYAAGPLGAYYQVSTNFVDVGSRSGGQAGLYHYTTQTTQAKELCSVVNLGAHYVATVGGVPADDDGDWSPDYVEDLNGNGAVDLGETHWQHYVSENGLIGNPGLEVFTPIR